MPVDASALPHLRIGGPPAAAQRFGARERFSREEASTMTDLIAGQGLGAPKGGFTFTDLRSMVLRGDLALAFGVLTILVVLIMPLPAIVLDLFLAISITLSILILMTALFIQTPLEFSAFPTILLISTMLRLSLNMASTRLILSHGHEGTAAAGHVIEAFGNFVMGGNFVIGIIVFAILVIVNFVVITKGSGRIAEVAARFTLDAMPGKQMAIDADLSAGLIDEATAKKRRKDLEDESGFFGAMDGASKFVRGDAIAGLLVVFINIIGGIIIGVAQQGLSFGEAARTYTLLTVGDGLVTQVPALIVSTAAGLLVSKAGISGAADKALMKQLSGYPQALGMSAGVMLVLGLLPGIPMLPFLALGVGAAYLSYSAGKRNKVVKAAEAQAAAAPAVAAAAASAAADEPISASLKIDDLKIELGYALLPLVNGPDGTDRLTEQIKALRKSLAVEMGFVMPSVRILDNVQLEANTYVIKIKEVDAGTGRIWPAQYMVMDPGGNQVNVPGIHTTEPTFGLPATWVDASLKEEATMKGYTVVDAATVLSTHLTELLKGNTADLLSYGEVQKLLKDLPKEQGELVKDIERISIRDLSTILEGVADALAFSRNPSTIVEHVRARLARQICAQNTSYNGYLPLIALSAKWEQAFAESIIGTGEDRSLAMQPSRLSEFMTTVRDRFEQAAREGEAPVLVTSASIRPFVRSLVERFRSQTTVLSQAEIHPRAKLKTVGSV
jgi:flagellar biosynthesis protein FlhA